MFKRISFVICFVFLFTGLIAQSAKAFEKAGDKSFQQKDYAAALEYYRSALEINDKKISIIYKYAEVARLFYALDFALDNYKKVKQSAEADKFPLTDFWLGEVYRSQGKYDIAIGFYDQYLKNPSNSAYNKQAEQAIQDCNWALDLINNSDDVVIQQLNKRVNTPFSEFGPLQRGDTLYYTSFRFDNTKDSHDPPRKISKVMTSIKELKVVPCAEKFNIADKLTAHTTFSKDGNRIYYTVCEYGEAMEIRCDIYYRDKDKKRRRWGNPKKSVMRSINPVLHLLILILACIRPPEKKRCFTPVIDLMAKDNWIFGMSRCSPVGNLESLKTLKR